MGRAEPPDAPDAAATVTRRRLSWLTAVLVLAAAGALLGRHLPARLTERFATELPSRPHWLPELAGPLYVLLPLTLLANFVLWMAPGLCLTLAFGAVRRAAEWLLLSFLAAYAAQVGTGIAVKLVFGLPLDDGVFVASALGVAALSLAVAWWRGTSRHAPIPWPLPPGQGRRLAALVAPLYPATVLLVPVLLWQDLNGDGFEALYIGESLHRHLLPRWPTESGLVGVGVGMFSQAFLNHWMDAWFGTIEAAPRLPVLLGLPVVLAGLVALGEWCSPRTLRALELTAVAAALGGLLRVMTYSAGYNPYVCEIASPGAYEMTLMAAICGGLLCLVDERRWGLVAACLVAHLARPSGLLVFGLAALACAVVGGAERGPRLRRLLPALAACLAVSWLHETFYAPAVIGDAALSYDAGSAVDRLRYLTFSDPGRLAFLVVPCGVLPALALLAWRRQDELARILTLVCADYLALLAVVAFVSLHHFTPVMVLPVVVLWRLVLAGRTPPSAVTTPAALVGCALAAVLAWPPHTEVHRSLRELGARIADARPDPGEGLPAVVERAVAIEALLPTEGPAVDPARTFVASPACLAHYASLGPPTAATRFLFQPASRADPLGWRRALERDGAALLVRAAEGRRPRAPRPPRTDFAAPLLALPRDVLHRHRGVPNGRYDLDLFAWLGLD